MKKKTWTKKRHAVAFAVLRPFVTLFGKIKYGFVAKKYKLDKKQGYLIVSNHQSLLDPLFLALSFNRPIYFVATDNLFNKKVISKLLTFFLAPISKRKNTVDTRCIMNCLKVGKENGCVCIFPEGNRAWGDFQFKIEPGIAKLARKMNLPVILYHLKGGYGVDPRWNHKIRRGKFTGEVAKIITVEEMKTMNDDELYDAIVSGIKVIDSDSNELFKSKIRAEYLERQLFICPKCNSFETLYSKNEYISCTKCGFKAEYLENLKIKPLDEEVKFEKLVDWYQFQLDVIKNYNVKENEVIVSDEDVRLYEYSNRKKMQLVTQGKLTLTSDKLTCGNLEIPINSILNSSPIGGSKFNISTEDKNYFVKGTERFNPLKYVLFLNILEGPIKNSGGDEYYGLSIKY